MGLKSSTILRFEDVSYRYPAVEPWTLRELHLDISQGRNVLLAGASGSGKSTFCRASTGLIPHFHGGELTGRVLLDGLDTRQHPVYRLFTHAGLVFQNPDAQLFNQTVEAELAYGLESLGLSNTEIEGRLAWAGELIGLGPLLSRSPHMLSGGEKQKVALGAILALRPRMLLLDEPFTHLDPAGAEILRNILRMVRAEGIAVLVVEHRLHEVIADVDRLLVIYEGRIVSDGFPREVMNQEVSGYGLNLPPLIRLFRASGWSGNPLSVEEALRELKSQNLFPSFVSESDSSERNSQHDPFSSEDQACVAELENVWFSYNRFPALCGISLSLMQGECVALVGRNGAGKTTLVKHLNGLLKPNQGKVNVLGRNTLKTPVAELARHVGFAWQNPNDQLFQANVNEEVLMGPRALRAYDSAWCNKLFERFNLNVLLDRSPFQLSEGQKKRVSFAAALAVQPELVVLDEPTAGQDESFRRELGRLIRELRAEGRTIVLVTHDLEFAAENASRWIAMAEGQVVADGKPEAVMGNKGAMTQAGLRPTQRFQLTEAIESLENRN
jgi:energy-coupling factor transport system ATP-binding protein